MTLVSRVIWASLLILVLLGCSRSERPATGLSPCSVEGQARIQKQNRLSLPAHDNIFEIDPVRLAYSEKHLSEHKTRPFDDPNPHGDQCRSVLGPLPVISCPDSPLLPVTFHGHVMTTQNGKFFEDGKPTAWKPTDGCDRPGHIGALFAKFPGNDDAESCSPTTRLGGTRSGNVYWTWLCHNVHEDHYEFLTVIGSNMETGETCFLGHDISDDPNPAHHVVAKDVIPPGGIHPDNPKEREAAREFWEPGHMFVCLDCHGANGAFLTTPATNQKQIGGDGRVLLFPRYPDRLRMNPGSGFRVIGTGQNIFSTDIPLLELRHPKAIVPMNDNRLPDRTCTKCHQLTDQEHFLRLARLSVGLEDTYLKTRKDAPWMPLGIDATDPHRLGEARAAVARYERAFTDPNWRYSEKSLLSECPAPQPLAESEARASRDASGEAVLRFTYANDYGHVPLRDDVRFQVRIEGSDASRCTIRDLAPDSLGGKDWRLTHPTAKGVTYTYRVQPYRYCYDRKPFAFGAEVGISPR